MVVVLADIEPLKLYCFVCGSVLHYYCCLDCFSPFCMACGSSCECGSQPFVSALEWNLEAMFTLLDSTLPATEERRREDLFRVRLYLPSYDRD